MSSKGRNPKIKIKKDPGQSAQKVVKQTDKDRSVSEIGLLTGLVIAVCAAVLIVHWPALSAQAMFFDDNEYLTENSLVQNPGWASAWRFLSEVLEPSTVHGYYQPLTMISLMVDYTIGGRTDNLLPFHCTSLALHIANTALVIVLLYLLFGRATIAAAAGLLFGLHPMTVEPIPWIGERKTLLAAFFALWCLVLYVSYTRRTNRKLFMCCVVMYILALMAKPTTVPLPMLLLLLDFWPLQRLNKRALMEKLPLFCFAAIFALITVVSQSRTAAVTMPTEYGYARILLILCHNIIFYLYKIICPVNLCPYYPFPEPLAISNSMILTGVVGSVILIPALVISLRKTRALLTGWLFFFIAIFPTMGVIGFTVVIASDKYAYLPSVGLVLVLAWLLRKLWVRVSGSLVRKVIIVFFILVLAIAESVVTRRCLDRWQNTEVLSQHMLNLVSNSPQVYSFAACELVIQSRYDEAIEHFERAIEIGSDSMTEINYRATATAHYNLGLVLAMQNRLDEAIEQFYSAVRLRKSYYDAHFQLANTLVRKGHLAKAIEHYNQVLRLRPGSADIHKNLALALVGNGKIDEAIEHYNQAKQLGVDAGKGRYDLGNLLLEMGKTNEAILYYRKVVEEHLKTGQRFEPGLANARYNLANALQAQGTFDEAASNYRQILQVEPAFAEAHYNLAVALAKQGKNNEAIAEYRHALRLEPDNVIAHGRLGLALASISSIDEAIKEFRIVLAARPDDVEMHCNLGILLERQGKIGEAVKEYRRALQINPEYTRARQLLEAALAKKQNG